MDREGGAGRRASGTERFAQWAPAAGILLFHLAFLPGYGVFRDELYYIACGRRPGWGYVDHPPLVGWVAWLVAQVAGESHLALRVVAALAMAATVWLAGRIAVALGGGLFASALAGIATGLAPVALSLGSTYSMNAFDLLFWALIAWILVRVLSGAASGSGSPSGRPPGSGC
jgi:4-amino-4-deoxy-L-arabinose transferase-like glycosyltransferase